MVRMLMPSIDLLMHLPFVVLTSQSPRNVRRMPSPSCAPRGFTCSVSALVPKAVGQQQFVQTIGINDR